MLPQWLFRWKLIVQNPDTQPGFRLAVTSEVLIVGAFERHLLTYVHSECDLTGPGKLARCRAAVRWRSRTAMTHCGASHHPQLHDPP